MNNGVGLKKKITNFIVWLLLSVVGAWITFIACLTLYLQVGFEKISLIAAIAIFLAVLALVVSAVYTLGSMLSTNHGGTKKCLAR